MKKSITIIALLVLNTMLLKAQDIVQLKSGEFKQVTIISDSLNEIHYKLWNTDGPVYIVNRADVSYIKHAILEKNDLRNAPVATRDSSVVELVSVLKLKIKQDADVMRETKKQQDSLLKQNTELISVMKKMADEKHSNKLDSTVSKLSAAIENSSKAKEEESKWKIPVFGLGLNVFERENFNTTEQSYIALSEEFVPLGHSILMTINTSKNFRLEPEYGKSSVTTTNDDNVTTDASLQGIGIGLFPMYQTGKTNIYLGSRFTYHSYMFQQTSSDDKVLAKQLLNGFSFNPTFGSEYSIAKHFSLGAEISISYYWKISEYTSVNGQKVENSKKYETLSSQSRLIIRFYL